MKELILGGARSGKSRLAEQLAIASGLKLTYIATATADDAEMRLRVAQHRQQRSEAWTLIEEPRALANVLRIHASADRCILVDCLTLWLSNLLGADQEAVFETERHALMQLLPRLPGHIILVSNETGLGIVPLGALTRRYTDEAGRLHQDIARCCDRVIFTLAGLPLILKGNSLT